MQKPIEKDIVVDDQLIHYYHAAADNQKKDTVVFLHGWGSNSTLWFSSVLSLVQEGYELYFLDLPGFGKSQTPSKPFQLQNYADIVSHFITKLEIQKPIIVGHSFGGKTAIRIASKKTIPLTGLVLVDSSGLPHTTFATQTKIRIAKSVKPIMDLPFMQGIRSSILRLSGSDDYVAFPLLKETFINVIREHVEFELPQVLERTLIIWGGSDDNSYTPVSDVNILHRLIPHASAHIIEHAGHYCFLDCPQEFRETLLEFFKTLHGKN
jgi:pimeloyl-ACP methyl ester carboxylesterase